MSMQVNSKTQETSKKLFSKAKHVIPGGVNSPVRAFKSVGGDPLFISSAQGAYLKDVDGNRYIDLINSWGPMILGHGHPAITRAIQQAALDSASFGAPCEKEVEMAELICGMVGSIEKVRMVNSGTEATMSAIRLARGYTGRDKIIKFQGCYHGHGDSFLIAAGSGAMTFGVPDSKGVTKGTASDTLTAEFNNLEEVEQLIKANKDEVAAIILEPVAGNMGVIVAEDKFLKGLRRLCDEHGIVLIFDEVMTGFRLAAGGAQEVLGIKPDITTLGKIIGGGMPVGAYGGKKEIMDFISPDGPVYQAGTLSGNPVAMAAGTAMLNELKNAGTRFYEDLDQRSEELAGNLSQICNDSGLETNVVRFGSMITLFFTDSEVRNLNDAKKSDTQKFASFFRSMLNRGVYLPPSQFESWFLCCEIGSFEIDEICSAAEASLAEIKA